MFKTSSTTPLSKELLMIAVTAGLKVANTSLSRRAGMISDSQVDNLTLETIPASCTEGMG